MIDFGEIVFHGVRLEVMQVTRSNSNHVGIGLVSERPGLDAAEPECCFELSMFMRDAMQLDALLAALPKAASFVDHDAYFNRRPQPAEAEESL